MKKSGVMVYKRYYIKITVLLVLLAFTLYAFYWAVHKPGYLMTSINLGLLALAETAYLVFMFNKTNRDLNRFFEAFRFHENTITFSTPKTGKTFSTLHKNLEILMREFQNLRTKTEKDKHFYLNTLNHIGTGLVVMADDGSILFSNRAIEKMLGATTLSGPHIFDKLKPGLADQLMSITPENRELLKVILNNEIVQLSLRCSVFRIEKKLYRVFSFQDIKSEIEKNEAEAWQKLIRIITHEITNSVSPITLTSSGIIQMLERNGKPLDAREIDNALLKSVLTGMHAIRKRSKGLASFVENYHTIYRLPQPALTTVPLNDLFKHIEALMASEFMNKKASLNTTVAPISLVLTADEKMITQVIINLLQNALQALEEAPDRRISLSAWQINDQVRISVTDHGKGIPPEMLDTVFVPFYTSRSEGSGIGLSLSREIMKLHGGGIRVYSDPGKETTFTLIF